MAVLGPFWFVIGSRAVVVGNKDSDSVILAPRHVQMTKSPAGFELLSVHKHFPTPVSHVHIAYSPSDGGDGELYARRLTHPTTINAIWQPKTKN